MIGCWWSRLLMAKLIVFEDFPVRYSFAASDFHRPRALISSRESPADTAMFAAPRRKEWPEYLLELGTPALRSEDCMFSENQRLLNGPMTRANRGLEGECGYLLKRRRNARTGQAASSEYDSVRSIPLP